MQPGDVAPRTRAQAPCGPDLAVDPTMMGPIRPVDWAPGITPFLRHHWCPGAAFLAGYPRSGAALIRTILAHCFGHITSSVYREQRLTQGYEAMLKHVDESEGINVHRKIAQKQSLLTFKTHQRLSEPEELPAIVIVRDARRIFSSLLTFFQVRLGTMHTMEEVITGQTNWGNWSDWIRSWIQYGPPCALWLRYEDILADRKQAVDRIARHFGIEPQGYDIPDFAELKASDPTIFRKAENEGNGGMDEAQENLFWLCHGPVMNMLGYYRD